MKPKNNVLGWCYKLKYKIIKFASFNCKIIIT